MESHRTTTTTKTICGTRSILNKSGGGSGKTEKTVTIVEPTSVREKRLSKEKQRIEQYKEKVNDLIYAQIQRRKKEFVTLKTTAEFQRTCIRVKRWIFWLLALWLLLSMIVASLCHANNPYCQLYWYETLLVAFFGCFTSSEQEPHRPVF